MPQIYDVDVRQSRPEPTGVEELFSKVAKLYKEEGDKSTLDKILKESADQQADENNFENTINKIRLSNMSPSAQAAAIKTSQDNEKILIDKRAAVNKKYKDFYDQQHADQKEQAEKVEKKRIEDLKTQKEDLARENQQASIKDQLMEAGYDEPDAERLSKVDSPVTAASRVKQKNKEKEALGKKTDVETKEKESQQVTQTAYDAMAELVPHVGRSGIVQSYFGGDTAKAFAKFTSLNGALEAELVDKVSRGTLSNSRFQYIIKNLLPTPSDSQAEIKGKLEAMAIMLKLDPSSLGIKPSQQKKDPHEGMVQVIDPNGIPRWLPKDVAAKLKG